jgi:hypothetical protein
MHIPGSTYKGRNERKKGRVGEMVTMGGEMG